MVYLKWLALMPASFIMAIVGRLLAPFLPFFATEDNRLPDWLSWFATDDNDLGKLFKNPCSQAELNKIVPFGFSLQRQKMVFFLPSK